MGISLWKKGESMKENNMVFILLNDFTCRETRLHNADWFNRMITLGSIQRYAVYIHKRK